MATYDDRGQRVSALAGCVAWIARNEALCKLAGTVIVTVVSGTFYLGWRVGHLETEVQHQRESINLLWQWVTGEDGNLAEQTPQQLPPRHVRPAATLTLDSQRQR